MLYSGPVPAESNPPINPQYYQPSRFVITAISLGATTTITVSGTINYVIGQQVRILLPISYGCRQLSGTSPFVIGVPSSNQVIVDIDSTHFAPFAAGTGNTLPQIMAIGDVNTGAINASGRSNEQTFIPGSFIDISPS